MKHVRREPTAGDGLDGLRGVARLLTPNSRLTSWLASNGRACIKKLVKLECHRRTASATDERAVAASTARSSSDTPTLWSRMMGDDSSADQQQQQQSPHKEQHSEPTRRTFWTRTASGLAGALHQSTLVEQLLSIEQQLGNSTAALHFIEQAYQYAKLHHQIAIKTGSLAANNDSYNNEHLQARGTEIDRLAFDWIIESPYHTILDKVSSNYNDENSIAPQTNLNQPPSPELETTTMAVTFERLPKPEAIKKSLSSSNHKLHHQHRTFRRHTNHNNNDINIGASLTAADEATVNELLTISANAKKISKNYDDIGSENHLPASDTTVAGANVSSHQQDVDEQQQDVKPTTSIRSNKKNALRFAKSISERSAQTVEDQTREHCVRVSLAQLGVTNIPEVARLAHARGLDEVARVARDAARIVGDVVTRHMATQLQVPTPVHVPHWPDTYAANADFFKFLVRLDAQRAFVARPQVLASGLVFAPRAHLAQELLFDLRFVGSAHFLTPANGRVFAPTVFRASTAVSSEANRNWPTLSAATATATRRGPSSNWVYRDLGQHPVAGQSSGRPTPDDRGGNNESQNSESEMLPGSENNDRNGYFSSSNPIEFYSTWLGTTRSVGTRSSTSNVTTDTSHFDFEHNETPRTTTTHDGNSSSSSRDSYSGGEQLGKWTSPYFDCGVTNAWLLTYSAPFYVPAFRASSYSATSSSESSSSAAPLYFRGVVFVSIDLGASGLIDQCAAPGQALLAHTNRCHRVPHSQCQSLNANVVRRGAYVCKCERGYYPAGVSSNNNSNSPTEEANEMRAPVSSATDDLVDNVTQQFEQCHQATDSTETTMCWLLQQPRTQTTVTWGAQLEHELIEQALGIKQQQQSPQQLLQCVPCAYGCDQCTSGAPCRPAYGPIMRMVFAVIQGVCLFVTLMLALAVYRLRKSRSIAMSRWIMLEFLLAGAMCLYAALAVRLIEPVTQGACFAEPWLRELGFGLAYGCVTIKLYRMYAEFATRKAHRVCLRDKDLVAYLMAVVLVVVGYMAAWTALVVPFSQSIQSTDDNSSIPHHVPLGPLIIERVALDSGDTAGHRSVYTRCRRFAWDHVTEASELAFLLCGVHLVYRLRNARREVYSEKLVLTIAIFVELAVSSSTHLLRYALAEQLAPEHELLVLMLRCHFTITLTLALIIVPKLWQSARRRSTAYALAGLAQATQSAAAAQSNSGASNSAQSEAPLNKGNKNNKIERHRCHLTCEEHDHHLDDAVRLHAAILSNGHIDLGAIDFTDISPDEIRAELRRCYAQLQVLKNKVMRRDNPHISKRRGGKKCAHRKFSLPQAFHHHHHHHHHNQQQQQQQSQPNTQSDNTEISLNRSLNMKRESRERSTVVFDEDDDDEYITTACNSTNNM
ncbi:putative G-protein coupled receptor [Fragariocoptes setiger]|uniref:G-protein coupled receptor n=1 Tax=Fragariocoptes setiger TaxID=1670756 RepID=A0ABQ7S8J1_9ACAR|nr:putative G-protein coupled receptor [Fragariocoptes setiger]